jgi:hypothetical protein
MAGGLLNPRSTRVETTLGDGVGKLVTSSGLYLDKCGLWIKWKVFKTIHA